MIKIAVASDKGMVTQHFGHCEGFMIYDTFSVKTGRGIFLFNHIFTFILRCFF